MTRVPRWCGDYRTHTRSGQEPYQPPHRDGTTYVMFERLGFLARLAALAPSPGVNLTRFHSRHPLRPADGRTIRTALAHLEKAPWLCPILPTLCVYINDVSLSLALSNKGKRVNAVTSERMSA
jgi:hypothetical protein